MYGNLIQLCCQIVSNPLCIFPALLSNEKKIFIRIKIVANLLNLNSAYYLFFRNLSKIAHMIEIQKSISAKSVNLTNRSHFANLNSVYIFILQGKCVYSTYPREVVQLWLSLLAPDKVVQIHQSASPVQPDHT